VTENVASKRKRVQLRSSKESFVEIGDEQHWPRKHRLLICNIRQKKHSALAQLCNAKQTPRATDLQQEMQNTIALLMRIQS
jgi:hypothetical protein